MISGCKQISQFKRDVILPQQPQQPSKITADQYHVAQNSNCTLSTAFS